MKLKLVWTKENKKIAVSPMSIIIIIALGIVFAFFLAEYMVRKAVNLPLQIEYMRFRHLRSYSVPAYLRHEKLFWKPNEFQNELRKKKGVFRIICLGDSVTQSHGKDGILPRQFTYEVQLERLLKHRFGRRNFEIINAGVGGYSSFQGVRYLKSIISEYDFDLIISWFGINDNSMALFFEDKDQRFGEVTKIEDKTILEHSALYLFLKNFVWGKQIRRVPPMDYYKNCEEMLLFARKRGADIVFVAPFKIYFKKGKMQYYTDYKNELEKLKEKYNCVVIDVLPFFAAYKNVNKFFIDLVHPNFEGNKIIAGILSKSLDSLLK
ncbi:MAG: SGNH/GDSL hydrolase family protein [Candidatus Omnitrophota bacterium]